MIMLIFIYNPGTVSPNLMTIDFQPLVPEQGALYFMLLKVYVHYFVKKAILRSFEKLEVISNPQDPNFKYQPLVHR